MMKKAQTEIIGLTMVLILIILGMVIVVRFATEEPIDYKKQFTQAELASNTLNALLDTTSLCNGFSMTEVLRNCTRDISNPAIICNGQNSCDYFIETTQKIFTETLEKWKVDYDFSVFTDEGVLFNLGNACIGDKKSELFPIPSASGTLFVKLNICG